MTMDQDHIDVSIAAIASKATYAGAGTTITGWLFSSQFGVLAGIVLGVLGLLVNLYFKRRQDVRDQTEHEARMRKLTKTTEPAPLDWSSP
jgi:hypothetical protein